MLLRRTKTKIKTMMRKFMRKLTSRMILKGKLHDSTHSTNSVFTPFRLRTNFHTEPNRILHWDQTYLSVSEIISQIHDDIRHASLFTKRRLGTKLSNELTTPWLPRLQNQKPAERGQMTHFPHELPPTSASDSEVVNKLLSTTLDLWSPIFHSFLVPPWKNSKDSAIKKFYFTNLSAQLSINSQLVLGDLLSPIFHSFLMRLLHGIMSEHFLTKNWRIVLVNNLRAPIF